jgi:PAS domain S-box-containing protein
VGQFVQRHQAEEARGRLADIVESSIDAIIGKTLEGVITSWNAGAQRLYGYSAEEVIGRSIALLVPPEREDELPTILKRLRRGERLAEFETVRVRKDGRRLDVSVTVSPIRDARGRLVGASAIARDISERKRAEEALREADRRKDEFLALLAHELRNPLAPIRNTVELLKRSGSPDPSLLRAIGVIERQVRQQARLLDGLLDVSRITQGKIQLCPERIDLSRLVRDTAEDCESVLKEAGLALHLELPHDRIMVDGDPTRLAQVLGNLLQNSAKFTDRGGEVTVRLTADADRQRAAISVRDTGMGIEPEMMPRLFEPFEQADRSLDRSRGGLGLGLAMVKGLVELHQGEVRAASEGSGRGAEFTVLLPISPP